MSTPTRHPEPASGERGAVTVYVILMATTILVVMGVAVDVSGHIHAMQEARAVAREAARVGGQQLQLPPAVRGQDAAADPAAAATAANTFLAGAGVAGTATTTGPDSIHVTATTTYQTRFLGIVGITSTAATGQADARITRSVQGVEQ